MSVRTTENSLPTGTLHRVLTRPFRPSESTQFLATGILSPTALSLRQSLCHFQQLEEHLDPLDIGSRALY